MTIYFYVFLFVFVAYVLARFLCAQEVSLHRIVQKRFILVQFDDYNNVLPYTSAGTLVCAIMWGNFGPARMKMQITSFSIPRKLLIH